MSWIFDPIRQQVQAWALAGDLPGAFQYAFVINALICGFFIGPILGGVGTMVVTKRLAFFSQAVGQAALTGVALGIILGEPLTAPYVSLFGFCILFGLVLNFTKNRTKMSTDTLIGVFLSISMAVGSSLLIFVASKVNIHIVDQVLFGSILTVNNLDMTVLVIISALVMVLGVAQRVLREEILRQDCIQVIGPAPGFEDPLQNLIAGIVVDGVEARIQQVDHHVAVAAGQCRGNRHWPRARRSGGAESWPSGVVSDGSPQYEGPLRGAAGACCAKREHTGRDRVDRREHD